MPVLPCRDARLYVTGNGQGSPCLDLRRVPDTLADATVGTDLVIIEGMGRAIHTNYKYVRLLMHPYQGDLTWRLRFKLAICLNRCCWQSGFHHICLQLGTREHFKVLVLQCQPQQRLQYVP